ncbi:hypothetical protein [Streptomyces fradiae]|uniref:hypothetical protein n=1 Tax=Streptomyces fradiae TaxID=1906 RepID=UPI003985EEA3
MRRRRLAPALLALPLLLPLLSACGTRTAEAEPAPDRAELEARAAALQTRPEHMYVTEADGFGLAEQSVGVLGDDGFSAAYASRDGGTFTLAVERGGVDPASCADLPRTSAPAPATCEKDGPGWYRATDGAHAYVRVEDGLRIRVSADAGSVDRAVLRGAAERAHRASDAELDAVLPERRPGDAEAPVERGDLPPEGDGAPLDGVGVSG